MPPYDIAETQQPVAETQQQPTGRVVPKGYVKLAAGTLRRIRVNRDWIVNGVGKPFIVASLKSVTRKCHCGCSLLVPDEAFVDEFFSDVIAVDGIVYLKAVDGIVYLKAAEQALGCGPGVRSAWVETSDELFVMA